MFYNKKIKELEKRVDALEKRVHEVACMAQAQSEEIDRLYTRFLKKAAKNSPNFKPTKKKIIDGKEGTEAAK